MKGFSGAVLTKAIIQIFANGNYPIADDALETWQRSFQREQRLAQRERENDSMTNRTDNILVVDDSPTMRRMVIASLP